MIDFIIEFLGFVILWVATDVGRKEESKVKLFSTNWWIILLLIAFGAWLASGTVNIS